MSRPLRIGVVGTGGWGTHVATQFHDHPDAEVVALTEIDADNREAAGERLEVGPDHRYDDHITMFEGESLDAVQITSPHALHHDHVLAALDHDLHVLCEKPLVTDAGDGAELVRRAEDSDRTVMIGYQRHVSQPYVRAREAIAAGEVDPRIVTAEIAQPWIDSVAGTWRVDPELSGGGQLYDSGSHVLDAVAWMLDEAPASVTAEMAFEEEGIDTQAALTIRFDGGTIATVAVSGDATDVSERIAVRGGGGRIVVEGEGWDDRALARTDAAGEIAESLAGQLSSYDKVDAFLRAISDGEAPPATARDGFHAVALKEAAYESAATGRRVDVDVTV